VQEKPEFVVLCAARVGGIKANMTFSADFLYENMQIQNNILWSAMQVDVKKLVFLGSSCIYPRESPQPMKESCFMSGNVEPTNEGYAIAKIAGVKLCEKIFQQYNKCFVSCMPTNIYGPNDTFNDESGHVIPALMKRFIEAKEKQLPEVVVWGTGTIKREFLYVDDLAEAILWMLKNYDRKEFVNVGTGVDISIRELAQMIMEVTKYEGKLVFDTTKPDGMPRKLLDVSALNKLGWSASTTLREGLIKTYDYFIKNYRAPSDYT
jgi:GDP-L-fucose synthase